MAVRAAGGIGHVYPLNRRSWPGCYYARSDPSDVARVEDRTFICSLSKDNAGPTNNWEDPFVMRKKLKELFRGCDARAHDVCAAIRMGPVGSPMSRIGVQLTDSAYAVVNMRIMARIGLPVFAEIDKGDEARCALHALGGRAAGAGAAGRALALQRQPSTSCIFLRRARSGATAPATAAMRCWAKSALRCASLQTSRATKAGWRSTC